MSEADWRALAEKAIGRGLDKLRSTTLDGLAIEPLYPRCPADIVQPWRRQAAWSIAQRIDHPDPDAANRLARLDLEGGADSLTLVFTGSDYNRGFGLAAEAHTLDAALADIDPDLIAIRLEAGTDCVAAADALGRIAKARRLTEAALDIDLGYDPIGIEALSGTGCERSLDRELVDLARKAELAGRCYLADGRPYHEAGATEVQELGLVVATGVAYLRRLETLDFDLGAARENLGFLLAADADLLLGLSKIRALRRLWARIEIASALDPKPIKLDVETSWRMMARDDPWTNAMRTTAATFAAGLGGADRIGVLPMSLPLGLPDAQARRLARNTQRILIDEAHLARVEDPAGGSGAIEALTNQLARAAWTLFQDIERAGGVEAALRSGTIAEMIGDAARKRAERIARLDPGLIGTSRFPSLGSPNMKVLDAAPAVGRSGGLLRSRRDAEPFEALRDIAEASAAQGWPLRILLVTLGSPADFGPRATTAANVFAISGLRTKIVHETQGLPGLAAELAAAGTGAACLCGTDAAYSDRGTSNVETLRNAGAKTVAAIGGDAATLGADFVIGEGCDVLTVLSRLLAAARLVAVQ